MIKSIIDKYKAIPVQIKASFWFLICAFLQRGISLITTPVFTRLLSTAEYGQYSVFNSWLSIVTVFVSLNLYSGVYVQGLVKFEDNKKAFASSLQGLCLTLVAVWMVVYLLFQDFWNGLFELTTVQMLAMLIMIWTSSVFSFWSVEQMVNSKYQILVLVTLLVSLIKPILGILLVIYAEDKVTARILGILLVEMVAYTPFFFLQMRRGKQFYSGKFWKYALGFNIPLLPHYLSMTVLNSADRIMIGRMVGESEAGIYNLAYSISMIMMMFNTALMQTIEPWLYRKIKVKKVADISKVAYPAFLLIAGVNIMLMFFAPEVIKMFAPVEYADAIWIIPPVAMSVFFMFLYTFFAVFEFYYEKTKYITLATMIGAVVNILLNAIFIDIFGYYAAGYTTLVCYMLFTLFHYCFMKKLCKIHLENAQVYNERILLIIVVSFLFMGFMCLFTYQNIYVRYSLVLLFGFIAFIFRKKIIQGVLGILNIKEKK